MLMEVSPVRPGNLQSRWRGAPRYRPWLLLQPKRNGGRIWQVFEAGQGRSSFDDTVEAFTQEFTNAPREQLMSVIDNCLNGLESEALITAKDRAALAKAK